MELTLYHYRAMVDYVYDGDTCTVNIDLGLAAWVHGEKLRLHRINAPEVSGEERPAGLRSRDALKELIEGKEIMIETIKDRKGKYGRYLAEIWYAQDGKNYINVNDWLVENGYAEYHDY